MGWEEQGSSRPVFCFGEHPPFYSNKSPLPVKNRHRKMSTEHGSLYSMFLDPLRRFWSYCRLNKEATRNSIACHAKP